jgi:hypothetical protein
LITISDKDKKKKKKKEDSRNAKLEKKYKMHLKSVITRSRPTSRLSLLKETRKPKSSLASHAPSKLPAIPLALKTTKLGTTC